jgi:hypothetical protein
MPISLNCPELIELNRLIEENIRIGRGQPPIYVDVANNLSRILSKQNHVVFGRRGSGKSTLLLSSKTQAESQGFLCTYFDSELIKENPYPDILISILIRVFEYLLAHVRGKEKNLIGRFIQKIPFGKSRLNKKVELVIRELEKLRTEPQTYDMLRKTTRTQEKRAGADIGVGLDKVRLGGKFDQTGVSTVEEATETTVVKIARLQQNLESYHNLIVELLDKLKKSMMLFIDDFYFITKQNQPDVVDYLHRVCKGTNMFIKLGTIRYRTKLYRTSPQNGRIIGVELDNDIFSIDLDYTLEDMAVMSSFLDQILRTFAEKVNIQIQELDTIFTEGGKNLLHLSSGGVPRDFLNLFLRGQGIASKLMLQKLEKQRVIGEAARQYLNEVKNKTLLRIVLVIHCHWNN